MLKPSQASVMATTKVWQHFLVVTRGVLLDVVIQALATLPEFRPDCQHVPFTAGDHDSDRGLIACPLALHGVIQTVTKYRGLFWMPWTRFRKAFSESTLTSFLVFSNMLIRTVVQILSGGDMLHSVMLLIHLETSVSFLFTPAWYRFWASWSISSWSMTEPSSALTLPEGNH